MDILKTLSADSQKLANIEARLFDVIEQSLQPVVSVGENGEIFEAPTTKALYKSTGGKPIGEIGTRFNPQQPRVLFNAMLDGIRENECLSIDGLKFTEMRDGQRIRFEAPMGVIKFTNLRGEIDESIVTLNLQTGYDGKTKTSMYLSTFRLVCSNGMKASVTELECSFKNTKNSPVKVLNIIGDIQKQLKNFETLDFTYNKLNERKVTQAEIDAYVEKVSGFKLDEVKENSKADKVLKEMYKGIEIEIERTGQTAYGLLQGITYYTNHLAKNSDNPDYIYLDSGLKTNDKAYNEAVKMLETAN